jgi:hypothetical protein
LNAEESTSSIRKILSEEEAKEKDDGGAVLHEWTPSVFILQGLKLEERT